MKEIKKLIKIITLFTDKKPPIYNLNDLKQSKKEEKLLLNIMQDKYLNDEDAFNDLYEKKKDSPPRYRMLKSRLRKKLYNHLFFLQPNSKISAIEEKQCSTIAFQAYILLLVGEHTLSEKLLIKALILSEKFQFTEITMDCLNRLLVLYPQTREFKKYYEVLKKIKYYTPIRNYEEKAQEIYFTSKVELSKSVLSKKNYLERLSENLKELKYIWTKSGSFNTFKYYHMLNLWHLELLGDFEGVIKYSTEVQGLLKENKAIRLRFDERHYGFIIVYAHLRTKQFSNGLVLARKYLKIFNPYSNNWFAFMQHYFLLAMHANNYQLAVDLIFEVDKNPYFNKLNMRAKEFWSLYKAYIYFLNPKSSLLNKFNYQEFITTLPVHSKDKLGHNIAILILQFLYHLKNKDFDQLYYKEGALRKYLNTYLKDPNSQRSRYFFRLLIVAIRADFNPEKTQKKAVTWLEKLKVTPTPGDAYAEIEIIPYEKLWELILNLMKE